MPETLYTFEAADQTAPGPYVHETGLAGAYAVHIDAHDGPVRLKSRIKTGPWRSHPDAKRFFPARTEAEAAKGVGGWTMDWEHFSGSHTAVAAHTDRTRGEALLALGRQWIGHCYATPGVAPPDGCSDCSGFFIWLVAKTCGVVLPHQTKAIWSAVGGGFGANYTPTPGHNAIGAAFTDARLALPGDGVEMFYPAFNPIATDRPGHIGVLTENPAVMLDERSPSEPVGLRPIEEWALQGFIRIFKVNGPLGT